MAVTYLFWGIAIGLMVAIPLGPVNLICIRRSLSYGPVNGFVVGMGAAVADTIFGAIAAFGLTSVMQEVERINGWVEIMGGVILLGVSINLWRKHPHLEDVEDNIRDRLKASFGAFLLTIVNPMTILGFVALFVALGLGDMGGDFHNALLVVIGVFMGSGLWWATLCQFAGHMKKRLSDDHLVMINRISALIVAACGLWALFKGLS